MTARANFDTSGFNFAPDTVHVGVTVFTSESPICKEYRVVDGEITKRTLGEFVTGEALLHAIVALDATATLRAFSERVLKGLESNQAIGLGTAINGQKRNTVTTLGKIAKGSAPEGAIARSQRYFHHSQGQGIMLVDCDGGGDLRQRLIKILPALAQVAMLVVPSSSKGVHNPLTFEQFTGGGEHSYIVLDDITRFKDVLEALFRLAWLAGEGWLEVSVGGARLLRSIIDASVYGAERVVYEGPPIVREPLRRHAAEHRLHPGGGLPAQLVIDAADRLAPLESHQARILEAERDPAFLARCVKAAKAAEAERVKDFISRGDTEPVARKKAAAIRATLRGIWFGSGPTHTLRYDDRLDLSDGTSCIVADILANPAAFDGRHCADPIEGVSYGKSTATIFKGDYRGPMIYSHAHGIGANYRLMNEEETKQLDERAAETEEEADRADLTPHGFREESESASAKVNPTIKATPFGFRDPRSIPPRQWLYGRHVIRKYPSVTVAPGGVGKSSLIVVEALAMATGRNLIGTLPVEPLCVWVWNGEDPREELERRLLAAALHYRISPTDVGGRLFVDSGRDMPIVLAKQGKTGTIITTPVVEEIIQAIRINKIDVLVIDPFVSSHEVSENDNSAINTVAKEWARIADAANCAVELVHHVRKTAPGMEITMEDARGASALLGAVRAGRVLNQMSKDVGEKYGLEHHRQYFRVGVGKANMAPASDDESWYRLRGVDLGNGELGTPGDIVAVVTTWTPPDPLAGITPELVDEVKTACRGKQWRKSPQAKKGWIGKPIAKVLGLDVGPKLKADRTLAQNAARAKVMTLLGIWIEAGTFVVTTAPDERRETREFVIVAGDDPTEFGA